MSIIVVRIAVFTAVIAASAAVAAETNATADICRLSPGPDWIPLHYDPWSEPGSALDFTDVVPHHSPAGKFGRVVAVGDHFEFKNLPGVRQRFYGVNLCDTANLPESAEEADNFAANLARIGYNAVRIHHHERPIVAEDGVSLDPAQMEKLDMLVAACVRHGLYFTTDLFVSRSYVIPWRSLGIDRDGCIPPNEFKILCTFHEPAVSNLFVWARNFLGHVNPHTGRSLANEPALATLALVNEGNLGNWGPGKLRGTPGFQEAWEKWLAEKVSLAKERKDFDWSSIPATIPDRLFSPDGSTPEGRHIAAFVIFLSEIETRLFERLKAFVREECGCEAPLSTISAWYDPMQYQLVRTHFDYVDDHFYVDHPEFIEVSWRLPSRCPNVNPVVGPTMGARSAEFHRLIDKPFCLTEFNYSGPGRYRGVGGVVIGALGALQDWSGIWRFAWSHSRDGIVSPGYRLSYFDLAGDPLALATERAALCLFLRGDLAPLSEREPIVLEEAKLLDPAFGAPRGNFPDRLAEGWTRKTGTMVKTSRKAAEPQKEEPTAPLALGLRSAANQTVDISPDGTMLIATPRTAGGFAEGGLHQIGPLTFELDGTAATVWVSSLDGAHIASSSRILVTHLTDVQNDGIEYADADMNILLNWGKLPHIMRNGCAEISLTLEAAPAGIPPGGGTPSRPPRVFRLFSSGKRCGEVPAAWDPASGRLSFTARIDYDPAAATYLYEIIR